MKERLDFNSVELAVKEAIKEMEASETGSYEIQKLANIAYFKMPSTNGFDSCELAGFIINNSRKIGVTLHGEGGVAVDAMSAAILQADQVSVYSQ